MDFPISRNYSILSTLVVDVGTKLLRDLFLHHLGETPYTFFQNEHVRGTVRELSRNEIINYRDSNQLLSPDVDANYFDINLLYTLLTTFIPLIRRPKNGWSNDPDPNDFSIGAELVRLWKVGNKVIYCYRDAKTNDEEYIQTLRKEAKSVILRIAKNGLKQQEQYYREMIDRISADH